MHNFHDSTSGVVRTKEQQHLNPSKKLNSCGTPFCRLVVVCIGQGWEDANNKASSFLWEFAYCVDLSDYVSSPHLSFPLHRRRRCFEKLSRKWNGFFMTELYWHISLSHRRRHRSPSATRCSSWVCFKFAFYLHRAGNLIHTSTVRKLQINRELTASYIIVRATARRSILRTKNENNWSFRQHWENKILWVRAFCASEALREQLVEIWDKPLLLTACVPLRF